MIKRNKYSVIDLFVVSAIFMFLFQLESRLISYIYLFPQSVVLIESILMGSGIFLVISILIKEKVKAVVHSYLNLGIVIAFIIQIYLMFRVNVFLVDLIALSILFGLVFLNITRYIGLAPNRFYAVEVFGSLIGILLYIAMVSYLLEETILVIFAAFLLAYALISEARIEKRSYFRMSVLAFLLIPILASFIIISNNDLVSLVKCNPSIEPFKAVCLDDRQEVLKPIKSFTALNGRSDLYFQGYGSGITKIIIRNSGFVVGASMSNEGLKNVKYLIDEPRIPKLAYRNHSKILVIGSSIGGTVQAFQKYVNDPDIQALEIDKTVPKIYQDRQFSRYLPSINSYSLKFTEGRRFIELADEKFDVISVAIDAINSVEGNYVDESTSIIVTKEAMKSYISHLNDGGFLILEQYYPRKADFGNPMAVKFLETLFSAQEQGEEQFKEKLILYTWAFTPSANSQRFVSIVYKKGNYSDEDFNNFLNWHNFVKEYSFWNFLNPTDTHLLHAPNPVDGKLIVYEPFFDKQTKENLSMKYDLAPISDEKPFRHKIMDLLLPKSAYFLYGALAMAFTALLFLRRKPVRLDINLCALSALVGIGTFGLQYLLFYRTAAFLHTNLIYFSAFLAIPLVFSAIGGYFSLLLSKRKTIILLLGFVLASILIGTIDIFRSELYFIFLLIGFIFVFSGVLFPMLLDKAGSIEARTILYAINIFAGGLSFLILITLHGIIGWSLSFAFVTAIVVFCTWWLLRKGG